MEALLGDGQGGGVNPTLRVQPIQGATRLRSVQLKMQRILTILKRTKQIGNIRMLYRLSGIICNQVLFTDISHIIGLIIFGQQVIEWLFLKRATVLGNRCIPFIGIRKFRIDIKNNTPKGMFLVPDNLSEIIFRARL